MRAGLRMWNPRWISLASDWTPESRVSTPESTRQVIVIALLFVVQGWIPRGVASQKNRSDAGDMPRLAPQHTFSARKEPENNGLGFSFSPFRYSIDPKKPSPTQVWRVFSRITDGRLPVANPPIFTHHRRAAGPRLDSGWSPESSRVSTQWKWGEPSSDALSPSCLSGSMDLLHLSKTKVLQYFYARHGR